MSGRPREQSQSSAELASADELLEQLREEQIRLLQLQFTDILGRTRTIEVPEARFREALTTGVALDAGPMEGLVRVEESDLLLRPDRATLRLLPWAGGAGGIARVVCDLYRADGSPFEGDPRGCLKRLLEEAGSRGFRSRVAAEAEFFLLDGNGAPAASRRGGADSDGTAAGREAIVRHAAVEALTELGLAVEMASAGAAPHQHRIALATQDTLQAADAFASLRSVVHAVAARHGARASWMPKPFVAENGSGMHTHHSLSREERNAFWDPETSTGVSDTLRFFIGGLLQHARAVCAVTNPLVNSYKRFVPGFGAPVHVAWGLQNRSALVRVVAQRTEGIRCELRLADCAANPYLSFAVQIAAGMDGIRNEIEPGEPMYKNLWTVNERERQRLRIELLPRTLAQALDELEQDRVVRTALGEHVFGHYVEAKRAEWAEYAAQVHDWEIARYLDC